jgi:hypothetical protein
MSIWNYRDTTTHPHEFADLAECPYCSVPLQRLFWDQRQSRSHNENYDDLQGFTCQNCGWWKVIRETGIWGPYSQSRHMSKFAYQKFCQVGCLQNLDPVDLTLPLGQLNSMLWSYRTGGFAMSPPSDEQIVASIFASHGYDLLVTSTFDGGRIAILTKGASRIGFQVTDSHGAILVEQILALTGALVRAGNTIGVFIRTSRPQVGMDTNTRFSHAVGNPIELIDTVRLYAALQLAQIPPYHSQADFLNLHELHGLVRVKACDGF